MHGQQDEDDKSSGDSTGTSGGSGKRYGPGRDDRRGSGKRYDSDSRGGSGKRNGSGRDDRRGSDRGGSGSRGGSGKRYGSGRDDRRGSDRDSRGGSGKRYGSGRDDRRGSGRDSGRRYDSDRGGRSRDRDSRPRTPAPPVDEDFDYASLDRTIRRDLRSLPTGLAESVGGQLFMAARLVDTDPALALKHAQHAQQLASRVACVRETLAVTAYANADYQVAKREATTVRRMTGDDSWLAMIADCERGLGRPERAVDLLRSSDLDSLPIADRVEALIVLAGARQDMGDTDAALAVLDGKLLRSAKPAPWLARIRMAYAELLAAAGQPEEAAAWWQRAEQADPDGSTIDPDRLATLEDAVFVDAAELEPEQEAGVDPDAAAEPGAAGEPEASDGAVAAAASAQSELADGSATARPAESHSTVTPPDSSSGSAEDRAE